MTALLSNRCLAFNKLEKFKEALADAEECIKIKPEWFRVSRLFSFENVHEPLNDHIIIHWPKT